MLVLDAPIMPGLSAAGIRLGSSKAAVLRLATPNSIEQLAHNTEKLHFGPVTVWINSGVVDQVGVSDGYSGKLLGCIGLGDSIADIQTAIGPVTEDDEDNLIVLQIPGWCFETTVWKNSQSLQHNTCAIINEIFVYTIELAGQPEDATDRHSPGPLSTPTVRQRMITLTDLNVYERFGGDVDWWLRSNATDLMAPSKWDQLNGLVTRETIIRRGLASAEFVDQFENDCRAMCLNEDVLAKLREVSKGLDRYEANKRKWWAFWRRDARV